MMEEFDYLRVYDTEHEKIRLGAGSDGGYVIADGIKYDLLIGAGVGSDVSFEDAFAEKYGVKCILFDGNVKSLPPHKITNMEFVQKNVSSHDNEKTTNILEYICGANSVFLKMDIETFEYEWIMSLTDDQLKRFTQIVIEFHYPFSQADYLWNLLNNPVYSTVDEKTNCLKRLASTHYLIHVHPNNCGGVTKLNGTIPVPNIMECTYVRKNMCHSAQHTQSPIPSSLDFNNTPFYPEIHLSLPFTRATS